MNSYKHAQTAAHEFGGNPMDYLPPRWYLTDALALTFIALFGVFLFVVVFIYASLSVWWAIGLLVIGACDIGSWLCAACSWRDYFARRRMDRG